MFEKIENWPQRKGKPLLVLEINPPRGVDLEPVFARCQGKVECVDLLNVTDSALARMKCAALPFASLLKGRFGKEVLVNLSCRDRNVVALQADLLGGWALGVRSIVALTGDAMTIGDCPERKGVFEVNSQGLLSLIATLNSGKDLAGNQLKGAPNYFAGAVVNPNARNPSAELKRLKRKREAGARYALSQPVFDIDSSRRFLEEAQAVGMPIFLGLLPLKSVKAAQAVGNIPGIKFPDQLLSVIQSSTDQDLSGFFLDHMLKIAEATKELVVGFHVVSGATPLLALDLAERLHKWRS